MNKFILKLTLLSFAGGYSFGAMAQNEVNITDTITGNQEQPKVLYIVPWQAADDDAILYQPLSRQIGDTFGHVERSEHRRHIDFLEIIEQAQVSAEEDN